MWYMVCGLLSAGCAEQQQYPAAKPMRMENIDKLRVMKTAEDVLVKMYFTIEKARKELNYCPAVGVDEAIRRTAEWYKSVVRKV